MPCKPTALLVLVSILSLVGCGPKPASAPSVPSEADTRAIEQRAQALGRGMNLGNALEPNPSAGLRA